MRNLYVGVSCVSLFLTLTTFTAQAVDGVIEINQAKALQGLDIGVDPAGFPVTITESGSYRLTGTLKPPAGAAVNVIEITGQTVNLDLNGFSLEGDNVCSTSGVAPAITVSCTGSGNSDNGIVVSSSLSAVRISDGTIRGMLTDGISAPHRAISLLNSGDLTTCYFAGAAESLLELPILTRPCVSDGFCVAMRTGHSLVLRLRASIGASL